MNREDVKTNNAEMDFFVFENASIQKEEDRLQPVHAANPNTMSLPSHPIPKRKKRKRKIKILAMHITKPPLVHHVQTRLHPEE